jgi:hypothetical protein
MAMNECDIFMAALEFDYSQRAGANVDKVCGKDTPLCGRVEDRLLRSHAKSGSLLEHPAVAVRGALAITASVGMASTDARIVRSKDSHSTVTVDDAGSASGNSGQLGFEAGGAAGALESVEALAKPVYRRKSNDGKALQQSHRARSQESARET